LLSKELDTKILQNIYFAYETGIISSAKYMKYKRELNKTHKQ